MSPIRVRVSNCAKAVLGKDRATLDALWHATRDIKQQYRISLLPKDGDADHYLIEGQD